MKQSRTSRLALAAVFALMLLIPARAFSAPGEAVKQPRQEGPKLAPFQLSRERQQVIGVTFATAEERDLADTIRATGTVEIDEALQVYVQTRFSGWIRRVFADQTYRHIEKGQPLFTIYSPDLASAESEYILSMRESRQLGASTIEGVATGAEALKSAALDRLRLFGVSARELRRLEHGGEPRDEVEIDSPSSGYIIERQAFPNMYVEPSTRLFTIASLTDVWVYAAIFQNQIGEMKVGAPVEVTVDSYPGRVFTGSVDYVWPALDPATRTAKVRCALPNRDGMLKIGMFVSTSITARIGRVLVVPDSGVLQTGTRNIVFVDRGGGFLDPVEVELGRHVAHDYVVRKGLSAGARVVSSANFLIDSESQLQAAIGAFAPPPPGAGSAAKSAPAVRIEMATEPDPPRKGVNRVTVRLTDSSGKPVAGASVSVVFFMPAMPEMGMSAMRAVAAARDAGNGTYVAEVGLESGGTWSVTISASKAGQQLANLQATVSATGGR